MTDPLSTAAPIVFGVLLLVYFSRKGRPGLGIASSLLAIVGLWLMAQVLIPASAPCPQGGCPLLAHLRALLDSRWFFMEYMAPLFVAALASRPFLIKGKLLPGMASGLGVIGILWAIDIAPVFTCQGETVECEWAWVGFLFINAVAMLQAAAVVLIDLAMHIGDQRRLERTAQPPACGSVHANMDPLDELIAQLSDPDPAVRERAAARIADNPNARASQALILALADPNWRVRNDAAWALGQLGEARAADDLLGLWDDPVGDVQQSVRHALTKIGDPRAIPRLVLDLESPQEWVRYESALLLREIGDETALPSLDLVAATHRNVRRDIDVRGAGRAAAQAIRKRLNHPER